MDQFSENRYIIDAIIPINDSIEYISILKHRKSSFQASVWDITIENEFKCFYLAYIKQWIVENKNGWSLYIVDNKPDVLGTLTDSRKSKIAKFVAKNSINLWHGYPSDYMKNVHDRPPTDILKDWVKHQYISKAVMSKIKAGQPCQM